MSNFDETAEQVDFAGGDSVDATLRRPHGPSDGLGGDIEGNLLPRNGTSNLASDFSAVSDARRIFPGSASLRVQALELVGDLP